MVASQNSRPKATTGERERNNGKEKTPGGTRRTAKAKEKRKEKNLKIVRFLKSVG